MMPTQQNPYASTSFTGTFGTNATYCSGTTSFDQLHLQPPIVLMPSSYDLNKAGDPEEEGCFNIILVCGSIVLIGTVSAAVGLLFGFI